VYEPLRAFLLTHLDSTDVFCFEECYGNMQKLATELLTDFEPFFVSKTLSNDEDFTNATYVRKTHKVISTNSTADTLGTGLCTLTSLNVAGTDVHIANLHGLPKPGKLDTALRIRQSEEAIQLLAPLSGIKIIGGDLNVLPETKSAQMFSEAGYENLITIFGIKTTRNKIAWDKHPGNELYFSDYVFIKGAKVTSFEVPAEIVSDHQPMILTIGQ
jgi:endonuclease/exonuclease/phosphatase (EEP) superfamily protein YafD